MRWPFLLTTDKWPESKRDMADNFFCVWLYGAAVTLAVVGDSPYQPTIQPSTITSMWLFYLYMCISYEKNSLMSSKNKCVISCM